MPNDIRSPEHLALALFGVLVTYGPIVLMVFARRRAGILRTCALLVSWGVVMPVIEHSGFTFSGVQEMAGYSITGIHTRYHLRMAGGFTLLAGVSMVFIAFTLVMEGRREGWFAVLAALLLITGLELTGAGEAYFHGLPPSWPVGLVIYSYIPAWTAALVLSYPLVFGKERT